MDAQVGQWRKDVYNSPNKTYSYMYGYLQALVSQPESWLSDGEKEDLAAKLYGIDSEDCSEEFSSSAKTTIRQEFEKYFGPAQKQVDDSSPTIGRRN